MAKKFRRIGLFTIAISLLLHLAPKTAEAQCGGYCGSPECGGLCGDLNSSGSVTSADVISMVHMVGWTSYGFVYPRECGDVDGYEYQSLRDLMWLVNHVFRDGPALVCQPDSTNYWPVPNSEVKLLYNNIFPAGDTLQRVQVDLLTELPLTSVSLVLRVHVDDSVADIVPFGPPYPVPNALSHALFGAVATVSEQEAFHWGIPNIVSGCWATFAAPNRPPGRYPLAYFDAVVPASSQYRTITIELFGLPDSLTNIPMMLDSSMVGWAITPVGRIVDPPGDVNLDRKVTSSDIIHMVNYTFKSGTPPQPLPVAGDQNCSGNVNSADIIGLVNYVFKGGAEPCDIHTACTVNWEEWTCP